MFVPSDGRRVNAVTLDVVLTENLFTYSYEIVYSTYNLMDMVAHNII